MKAFHREALSFLVIKIEERVILQLSITLTLYIFYYVIINTRGLMHKDSSKNRPPSPSCRHQLPSGTQDPGLGSGRHLPPSLRPCRPPVAPPPPAPLIASVLPCPAAPHLHKHPGPATAIFVVSICIFPPDWLWPPPSLL
uniref:Uncharacterized protein n=1 Tax=Myotis myotis TaxID=51298 RepID=A0A7J7XZJ1_MYOMY|nr:hypothetical protein mMyoMyo1_011346 [Myotis myotis]